MFHIFAEIINLRTDKKMKKIIILKMLALLVSLQVAAQEYEYVPFVREGVKWVCYYNNAYPGEDPELPLGTHYLTLEFKGDTVIDGKSYKAMHKYSGNAINVEKDTIPIYMREQDKVVYAIVPDGKFYPDCPIGNCDGTEEDYDAMLEGREFILYDFSDPIAYWNRVLNDGDEIYYNLYNHLYTDTIQIGNHLAKRYVGEYGANFKLIEGIGIDGFTCYTLCFFIPVLARTGFPLFFFSHVIENGSIIYKGEYYFPNTITGIDEVVAEPRPRQYDDNYYNLMGQPMGKDIPSTPGIYIHHGKKVVIR